MRGSRLVHGLPPSGIRKFFDVVSQMEDVVSLGVGEPDFVTPWHIRAAAIESIEQGRTQYTSNWGLLELRRAVARMLDRRFGLEYRAEGEILITVGVSEGLDLALRAVLNPGDEVLIPEPCYVSYRPTTLLAGGVPVPIRTTAECGFRVRAVDLETAITPRTRALLLNFPCNPTGGTLGPAELHAIGRVAAAHDLLVLSDEVYAELTYEGRHHSFAGVPGMQNRTLLLSGFSKAFAMTGWRMGYAAGPADLVGAMTKIHQYTMLSAPSAAQYAALEACERGEPEMEKMVQDYGRRRRFFVDGLNTLGLECRLPEGAFYAFPSIRRTGLSSEEFAERLLREERVAVVPGCAFGESGEGYVRCSYATGMPQLREALVRMERFLARLRAESANQQVRAARG
ncbi:MAG: aminotransferase class I/II-fold pyridoxal phosphate-dependent enzyme [Armatimonadetes bacterium]|nr:aminotransferase class I/II-fold pyridoxal phosphate-dependent enzyme [Armatimonadota bacterium]